MPGLIPGGMRSSGGIIGVVLGKVEENHLKQLPWNVVEHWGGPSALAAWG